jgi:hypothetical protein
MEIINAIVATGAIVAMVVLMYLDTQM